jgi:hypothetical protein
VTTDDGRVTGSTKIVDHGDDSGRWNLVLLGDGYTEDQLDRYAADVEAFCDAFRRTPPFDAVWSGINIFRVDVVSTDSGADDPAECGGTGAVARTYFDASFCNSGTRRLLVADDSTALAVADAEVPGWHSIMMLVNSTVYGGSGGTVAVFSLEASATEIAFHELGHSAFGLADEYPAFLGCGVDTERDVHPGDEPVEPNVTVNTDPSTLKWAALLTPDVPLPTTSNVDCSQCDPQPNPFADDTVGLYEGAHYYHCGAYRPQFDCRMRTLGVPYCAVCADRIRSVLAPYVPVDAVTRAPS